MSDSSPNNNEKQKSSKCLIWGSIALILASSTIGGAYYLSSIAKATTEVARLMAEEKVNVNTEDKISAPSVNETVNDSQTEAVDIPVETEGIPVEAVVDINQKAKDGLKERGIDVDWVRREDWDKIYSEGDVEGLHYLIIVESTKKLEWNTHRIMNYYLRKACADNKMEIVKLMIEKGADVNNGSWTPLHIAARYGYTEIARLLIKNGATVNKTDEDRWTPLYAAAYNGRPETVKLLLEAWADASIKNKISDAPFHIAARKGHTEMVKLLIAEGADVSITDGDENAPLHIAAQKGHTEIVKLLIAAGADVNMTGVYARTPLFIASKNGHTEIVELLKQAGAKE